MDHLWIGRKDCERLRSQRAQDCCTRTKLRARSEVEGTLRPALQPCFGRYRYEEHLNDCDHDGFFDYTDDSCADDDGCDWSEASCLLKRAQHMYRDKKMCS